jgi:hypothetical protein
LSKARTQLETASAEEDCQAIGLLCREVIISLAQAVYDPTIHESLTAFAQAKPMRTECLKRISRTFFRGEQQGSSGAPSRIAGVGAEPSTPPNRNPTTCRALRRSDRINDRRCLDHRPRKPGSIMAGMLADWRDIFAKKLNLLVFWRSGSPPQHRRFHSLGASFPTRLPPHH